MAAYAYDIGSQGSGLWFTITYDSDTNALTVTSLEGKFDLNAIWFGDGDGTANEYGGTALSKADNALGMNGSGVAWDGYIKLSSPGLGPAGENKDTFISAGETKTFTLAGPSLTNFENALTAGGDNFQIGVRATSVNGGGSIKGVGELLPVPTIAVTKVADKTTFDEGAATSITYTYEVKNTSDPALTNMVLKSLLDDGGDKFGDINLLAGFVTGSNYGTYYTGGDTDGDYLLDTNETWKFEYEENVAAQNAGWTNTNTVKGVGEVANLEVKDEDDETVTAQNVDPAIQVVKTASPATVLEGTAGQQVIYTYAVTNTSAAAAFDPLHDVALSDTDGTPTYVDGDDGDGLLEAGETWNYTLTETLDAKNAGDTHVNTVTATAKDDENKDASDTDDETVTYTNVDPAIQVVKTASPATVLEGTAGQQVIYTYAVTNTSAAGAFDPLHDVALSDTDGAPTYVDGDDGDGLLEAGETWNYTLTETLDAKNAGDTHVNTVTATAKDDENKDASDTDDETVTYTNVDPAIQVVKTASPATVLEGTAGQQVIYTYAVTNTSAAGAFDPLHDVALSDTDGAPTYVDGDDGDGLLEAGETWNYTLTETLDAKNAGDTHVNTVTATAKDDENKDASDTDDETVTYTNVDPAIQVVKTASPATVLEGTAGQQVIYTYAVTNTSAAGAFDPLHDVALSDTDGAPTYVDGDDGDGLLEAGETWNYTLTETLDAKNAGDTHVNTVTATAKDDENEEAEDTDDETVTYTNVAPDVNVVKTASVGSVEDTGSVTYTYTVTNTSTASTDPLTLLSLVDDKGTPLNLGDDVNLLDGFVAGSGPILTDGTYYDSGDTDNDGLVDKDETWTFSYTTNVTVADGGELTNTVKVVAEDDEGNDVEDTDEATVVNPPDGQEPPENPEPPTGPVGASQGYWGGNQLGNIPNSEGFAAAVGGLSANFDAFFNLDTPTAHTWLNPTSANLTMQAALLQTGNNPDITPDPVNNGQEATLVREAVVALLNFHDTANSAGPPAQAAGHDSFVDWYVYQRNLTDTNGDLGQTPNDAAILADLIKQVDDALSDAAGAYSVTDLTNLLLATHHA